MPADAVKPFPYFDAQQKIMITLKRWRFCNNYAPINRSLAAAAGAISIKNRRVMPFARYIRVSSFRARPVSGN